MASHSKKVLWLVTVLGLISFSSCVTTRQQYNEERGISEDSPPASSSPQSSVRSEDLNARAEAAQPPAPLTPSGPPPTAAGPVQSNSPVGVVPASGGSYSMDEIRSEMARLNGKVEELEHEKKLREDQRTEEQKKLQDKISELEKQLAEAQPKSPPLPEGKTPFAAGKDAYFNEHYEEAIMFLDKALSVKDTGKEAEEAFYIQGESYFKLKNYQKAIVNYSKFPEKFQKSPYHSKALLRIAECFEAMGLKEDAKAFYQNLVDQFPKTAEGKLAKKRLSTKKK